MIPFARYQFGTVIVEAIRCLTDNYVYLIGQRHSRLRAVIDPGESAIVEDFLAQEKLQLELILNTHHHADHVGGNQALQKRLRVPAFASAYDANRISGLSRGLQEGEKIQAAGVELLVMAIPGHTQGQLAYFNAEAPLVFVGDTLFSMGCGRLFEGTAAQMLDSIHKLLRLPAETKLFVGHEYTLRNGAFAQSVEPGNQDTAERLALAAAQLKDHAVNAQFVAPISIAEERKTNPFLRAGQTEIARTLKMPPSSHGEATELAIFTRLREMRNDF